MVKVGNDDGDIYIEERFGQRVVEGPKKVFWVGV